MFTNKTDKRLEEEEVIKYLISLKGSDGEYDLRHFYNVVYSPISQKEFSFYSGLLITFNILRTEFGFDNTSKPGDFDVIIIPFTKEKILFKRTAIVEVKVVRPTRNNPSRNANSLGITQPLGLIQDGFPLVALLHICMPEPLLEKEKTDLELVQGSIHVDGSLNNKSNWENRRLIKMDFFSTASADTQMKRLLSADLPNFIGLNAYGLNFFEDSSSTLATCSQDFWKLNNDSFNPNTKVETIEKVKQHFLKHKEKYCIRPIPHYA